MRKIFILGTVLLFLLSSCATILNGKYQKIAINHSKSDKILIDGKTPKSKKGKFLFERDMKPKQITLKSKGFKDENIVIMQYKKSPLHILSWIPFGVLIYPPFYDIGYKSWNYDKKPIRFKKTTSIEKKSKESKEIKINKVSVDIDKKHIKNRYFSSYRDYLRKVNKKSATSIDSEEEINIENTEFSYILNDILKEKGYIDTTGNVLIDSYLDNLIINATIKGYTIHNILNRIIVQKGGMIYIDMSIDWEILDYYYTPIYSKTITSRSGQFAIQDYKKNDKVIYNTLKDVMEASLIKLMKSRKVDLLLHDKSEIKKEISFEKINITRPTIFVTDLSQSIKSSLTIKSKKGFGSGFIISDDGYIITNYHVVSDSTDLKVILNNNSEYKAKIIRVSRIHDLALLKIDAIEKLIPFDINFSEDIKIASEVYAVGTPSAEDLSQTISKGIISGIRKKGKSKLIQTDASINNGNSGGPLVDENGVVIGIVSSKLKGYGVEGVAFGIPSYEIFDKLNISIE